jgi:hypothetical protein
MSDSPPARIMLRPLGSPLTIGMAGLAIASLVQSGVELRWTASTQAPQAGLILIAVPFVLQLLACVLSYLVRDGATGAAVGVLSTSWLAIGLVEIVSAPGSTSGPLGLLLVAAAVRPSTPPAAIIFASAACRFVLAGVHQLSGVVAWGDAAGALGLAVCALAAYAALAFELEGQRERTVLPTLRHGRGAAALDEPGIDVDRVAREPGVRSSA